MNKETYKVLVAQFLTAFADNAILFTAITMVFQKNDVAPWYVPALQVSFLLAFVFLAPWVGRFADSRSKPTVLLKGNLVKALGALFMVAHVEPLVAYAIVGLGAAIYSPAKYGILPELVSDEHIVKANGWIEGSTILAILAGTLVGALVSEYSIDYALWMVVGLFVLSGAISIWIKPTPVRVSKDETTPAALKHFVQLIKQLFVTPRARFATLGVSLFWAAATVLRVLLIAWAPIVLFLTETSEIAKLTMSVAVGIAIGSMLVPYIIPLNFLRRARLAAYLMGMMIIVLSVVDHIWWARGVLVLIGIFGGMFVVPINAALQEIGHRTIGSGGAVAIQNFFENLAMLVASGIYTYAAGLGAGPVGTMAVLGVLVVIATVVVSLHLPKDGPSIEEDVHAIEKHQ